MKRGIIVSTLCLLTMLNCWAGSVVPSENSSTVSPKQCLKELQQTEQSGSSPVESIILPDQNKILDAKESQSWFEKLVKHHKLGSLHFQDLIEVFYD